MCGEMTIRLILELASHLSMMEEIYGELEKTYIYDCHVSSMDDSGAFVMLYLFEGCFSIGQSGGGLSLMPFVSSFY